MITKLEAPLKRELSIQGMPYVLTITPTGFLLTQKGRRKGYTMDWQAFVSGETALATALTASLAASPPPLRSRPGGNVVAKHQEAPAMASPKKKAGTAR